MTISEHHVKDLALGKSSPRPNVEEYRLRDGRTLCLLAEGHPSAVMDMSFANQALCAEHLVKKRGRLEAGVHDVPPEIDREVARLKVAAMGVRIDDLTAEQQRYLTSWREGT